MVTEGKKKKLRTALNGQLHPGEEVLGEVFGRVPSQAGLDTDVIVALTDRRLMAVGKGTFRDLTLTWTHEQVTAVGTGRGALTNAKLVFTVPGDNFECIGIATGAEGFRRLVESKIQEAQAGLRQPLPPSAPPSNAGEGSDLAARLERLNDLHTKGLISVEEYEAKREQILGEL